MKAANRAIQRVRQPIPTVNHIQGSYISCLIFFPDCFLENECVFPYYKSETNNIFPDQLVLQMMRATDPPFKTK